VTAACILFRTWGMGEVNTRYYLRPLFSPANDQQSLGRIGAARTVTHRPDPLLFRP
jgi:hypothetical protein